MLFRCQWALIFVLFCSLSFAESITLQTYYPAPQGNYRSMRSGKICIGETCQTGDSQAQSGTLFAEKGVQLGTDAGGCDEKNLGRIFYSLDERAVMICTADEDDEYFWRQLGRGAVSEILMGRAISSENFIDWMHHETQDYFEPKRQHPSEYYFCSWQGTGLVKGEGDLLKITEISLQQEPRQGNYFVLYGGGQMEFHTGVEYTVTLNLITDMTHNEERNVDSFTLRSDGAIGEISMVDFPKRRVDLGDLKKNTTYALRLKIKPEKTIVHWDDYAGLAVGGDSFDEPRVPCQTHSFTLNVEKCSREQTTSAEYKQAYDNLRKVLSRSGGILRAEKFFLELYRRP